MTLPKGPLVGFDLAAPLGQAFLLKRRDIAEFEGRYVQYLAECAGVSMADEVLAFVTAICEFTPGAWQTKFYTGSSRRIEANLKEYLDAGLGSSTNSKDFGRWYQLSENIGTLLSAALGEGVSYNVERNAL